MDVNHKNNSFYKSFCYAHRGFCNALRSERNLRIHVCIGNLICYFAYFFKITRQEWAVLLAVISTVIAAELFNSAIEKAVDTATHEIRSDAMHAKDFAAAASLISAMFSILVGIAIFGDWFRILYALKSIFTSWKALVILAVLVTIDLRILLINIKGNRRKI